MGPQAAQRLALLAVGEVGRTADLSAFPPLKDALTSALSSSSEEIKGAASLALGAVCIGNLAAYLPFLLQAIRDQVVFPPTGRAQSSRPLNQWGHLHPLQHPSHAAPV